MSSFGRNKESSHHHEPRKHHGQELNLSKSLRFDSIEGSCVVVLTAVGDLSN